MNNKGKPSQATGKRGSGGSASGGKRNSRYRTSSGGAGSATAAAAANAPVNKNEEYVIDIVGLTHDGEGVGRANNFTLFVHGALPGEQALVKVLKVKKQYGYAKLMKLMQTSPDRVNAPCTIYKQCGGCQIGRASCRERVL